MSEVTISLPAGLDATLETRANAAGFGSKEDDLEALVRADCERAALEPVLEARLQGPFEPIAKTRLKRGSIGTLRSSNRICLTFTLSSPSVLIAECRMLPETVNYEGCECFR